MNRLFVLWYLFLVLVSGYERRFAGIIDESPIEYDNIQVKRSSLITVKLTCKGTGYLNVRLRNSTDSQTILTLSGPCDGIGKEHSDKVFETAEIDGILRLVVTGNKGAQFSIYYYSNLANLTLGKPQNESIKDGGISLHTFTLPCCDGVTEINYRYVEVTVEAEAEKITPVGKLIVTQNLPELYLFREYPNASTPNSMRLSFSTFGRIVLSDVSTPKLTIDERWYLAVVLFNKMDDKAFNLTVRSTGSGLVTDKIADYNWNIVGLIGVCTVTGLCIVILSSFIFYEVTLNSSCSLYQWLCVLGNWTRRGRKGLAYLSCFLGIMLVVSAIQIVEAKVEKMRETGNRDICYYNEKCYRPYTNHFDVSINGLASNIAFMIHGVMIIAKVSYLEANCATTGHNNYDYSIAYSFGIVYIFEGLGSMLYHICPNQIIFQFDTLFMFAISVCIAAAITDGYTARNYNDVDFYPVEQKSLRVPKIFLFFLGPAYLFNFLGNLLDTGPLPSSITIPFFVLLGFWVIFLLIWAAYKLEFVPNAWFKRPNIRRICEGNVFSCLDYCRMPNAWFKLPNIRRICEGNVFSCLDYCRIIFYVVYIILITILFTAATKGSSANFILFGMLILAGLTVIGGCLYFCVIDIPEHKNIRNSSKFCTHHLLIGLLLYMLLGLGFGVVAGYFFSVLEVTDKSEEPWVSREHNRDCMLFKFWDAHHLWHFFISHFLMIIALVVIQVSRPCRDCYTTYFNDGPEVTIGSNVTVDIAVGSSDSEPGSRSDNG